MNTTAIEQPEDTQEATAMNTATSDQPQAEIAIQPDVAPDMNDRRIGLSAWFALPEPSEEQIDRLNSNHEEAKAAHADALEKLERLNGEVRRFTEAQLAPKELETIVAAAQAAEVKARLLDGNVNAAEAQRVLKLASKRFEAAISAAREAEIVLPDVQVMVDEQRKVVEATKESLRKRARALGEASALRMLHRGVRSHLTGLVATVGKLQKIEDEMGAGVPIDIKLHLPGVAWFKPAEINAEA